MRVDQLAEMLLAMRPEDSLKSKEFYSKTWNVDDYKHLPTPEVKKIEESKAEAPGA